MVSVLFFDLQSSMTFLFSYKESYHSFLSI